MWTIAEISYRERIRKKILITVMAVGIVIMLILSGDGGNLIVAGKPVTGYENMLSIMHIIINAVAAILSVVLSIRTIPDEYSKKTSHMVWVRGISQPKYHGGLLIANCLTVLSALMILYFFLAFFMISHGHGGDVLKLFPAFFIEAVNTILICSLVSVLSIKLPSPVNAALSAMIAFGGVFYELLNWYKNIMGGAVGKAISLIMKVLPNLHGIQKQAVNVINGNGIDAHVILKGLFIIWIILIGLFLFRKKEA